MNFVWFRVPGLYYINYNPTVICIAGLAQLIITGGLRNCSVPSRGKEFISSKARSVFGAHPASHSIGIRSSFLGVKCRGVKFITRLHLVQRLKRALHSYQLPKEHCVFLLTFECWKQFSSQHGILPQQTSVFKVEDIYMGLQRLHSGKSIVCDAGDTSV